MYDRNAPLELDKQGNNPTNLVKETYVLNGRPLEVILPRLGIFFDHSVKITHNDIELLRGTQWKPTELSQRATMDLGNSCYASILITDSTLYGPVHIEYQPVGGEYRTDVSLINQRFHSSKNDDRNFHWNNIEEKPEYYNPTMHRHLVDDFSEFYTIADYLDRIREAILTSRTSLMVRLLETAKVNFDNIDCSKVRKNLPSMEVVGYDTFLYIITQYKLINRVSVDTGNCIWLRGTIVSFLIDTVGYIADVPVYWEFYTPDSNVDLNSLFGTTSGVIQSSLSGQEITYAVPRMDGANVDFDFYIGIKLDPNQEDYEAVSNKIRLSTTVSSSEVSSIYPTWVHSVDPENMWDKEPQLLDAIDDEKRINYLLFY